MSMGKTSYRFAYESEIDSEPEIDFDTLFPDCR